MFLPFVFLQDLSEELSIALEQLTYISGPDLVESEDAAMFFGYIDVHMVFEEALNSFGNCQLGKFIW